jgi:hypothetical protein
MMKSSIMAFAAIAFACLMQAAPAQAQQRVFVSATGSDSNPCSFASPCRSFQHAHDTVAANGEIAVLDTAGYGQVTISKSITITNPGGVEAGITAGSGTTAITVSAPGAAVVLRGLTLLGANTANEGIFVATAARVEIVGCVVSDFKVNGIAIQSIGSSAETSVLISNTIVIDNAPGSGDGIFFISQAGGGKIIAALDHVTVSNSGIGIQPEAVSAPIEIMVTDSHIDNNTGFGVGLSGSSAAAAVNVILKNVTFNQDTAGGAAIVMSGFSTAWLSQVTQMSVTGFTTPSIEVQSGTNNFAFSDGTNHLMGALTGGATIGAWPSN